MRQSIPNICRPLLLIKDENEKVFVEVREVELGTPTDRLVLIMQEQFYIHLI